MAIQILPPQLANQIAAGEVVERPASVVKELVENALDAGATKIDIEIDKGGHKRILIRDNGKGVNKEQLSLALSRHATSKISTLDDLEAIVSLGFRGEALASISSVSRLTFTSKPKDQSQAWAAIAEGLEMKVDIKPAAHPNGTSVEVLDLFFNTPARRKFLRAEKTEFAHIETLIKRIALSRPDVTFNLKHNGKWNKRLKAQDSTSTLMAQRSGRIADVVSTLFVEQSESCAFSYDDLHVSVWLREPEHCASVNPAQYAFVNGRMMRDKLLQHAIRQAFAEKLGREQQPEYVLYVELPADDVDVNVHPAKHEVRFHQSRLVHDIVVKVCLEALNQFHQQQPFVAEPDVSQVYAAENTQHNDQNDSVISNDQNVASSTHKTQPASDPNVNQSKSPDWLVVPGDGRRSEHRSYYTDSRQNSQPSYKSSLKPTGLDVSGRSAEHSPQRTFSSAPRRGVMANHVSLVENKNYAEFVEQAVKSNSSQNTTDEPNQNQSYNNIQEVSPANGESSSSLGAGNTLEVLMIQQRRYCFCLYQRQVWLLDILQTEAFRRSQDAFNVAQYDDAKQWQCSPLLVPVRIKLSDEEKQWWLALETEIKQLGFDVRLHQQFAIIKQVPAVLRQKTNALALSELFSELMLTPTISAESVLIALTKQNDLPTEQEIHEYLSRISQQPDFHSMLKSQALLLDPKSLLAIS